MQIKRSDNDLHSRMDILSGARLREADRMKSAIRIQDALRLKIGAWQGSKEIRKWRNKESNQ